MKVTKAVITAAGDDHSSLPLQNVVDRDGRHGTALRRTLDEVIGAGVEEVALIVRPGQSGPYIEAAASHASRLVFFEQNAPRGYGDAILRARSFVEDEPFLHLVSDHLYVSRSEKSCAAQLCDVAEQHACAVSAIQATRENEIAFFGTVGGTPVPRHDGLYEVSTVIEKPTPTVAEQELVVAGQRAGHYLCLFGMHVLTPGILELLEESLGAAEDGTPIDLSSSLARLAQSEHYLAFEVDGQRFNTSYRYGLLLAQLAITLGGVDRDLLLTELVSQLARNS